MGKAFEKQAKTIEDQGNKQIDALADLKPKEIKPKETKPNEYDDYFVNGLAKIRECYEPVDFYDITYNFKDLRIPSISFSKFKGPLNTFKSINNGGITVEDVDPKDKSPEQKKTIDNIENLYNSREEVVRVFNDYGKNMSRNIYESKQGTGLKILTPKKMPRRLPIALAQIKVY